MEIKFFRGNASTVNISSQETSWAVFTFNDQGDLFLSSDWGLYHHRWEYYEGNFEEYLKKLEPNYLADKLSITTVNQSRISSKQREILGLLVTHFLDFLKNIKPDITISFYNDLKN